MTQDQIRQLDTLIAQRDFLSALNFVREARILDPNDRSLALSEAWTLALAGKHDEARVLADTLINADPNDAKAYQVRALPESLLGESKEELYFIEKSLALDPYDAKAQVTKLDLLIRLHKFGEAIEYFESGDFPNTHLRFANNIGWAYLQLKKYDKAEAMLRRSLAIHGGSLETHFNLYQIHRHTRRRLSALAHGTAFLFHRFARILGIKSKPPADIPNANKYSGAGSLYSSDSNIRETAAIFKLLRGPNFWSLCNDTYSWVAVNIPFNALGKSDFEGDMDIVLAMHWGPPSPENRIYRGFEVKAIPVSKEGVAMSQKKSPSKHKKIKKQVKKLREFGCEQVFYLELYVLERGFSSRCVYFPTQTISDEIDAKTGIFRDLGCGYVYAVDEPTEDHHEERGGHWWFLLENVLSTTRSDVSPQFSIMATRLEEIYRRESKKFAKDYGFAPGRHIPVLSFCQNCKEVRMINMQNPAKISCCHCEKPLLRVGGQ